jgi:hypothetical protein
MSTKLVFYLSKQNSSACSCQSEAANYKKEAAISSSDDSCMPPMMTNKQQSAKMRKSQCQESNLQFQQRNKHRSQTLLHA